MADNTTLNAGSGGDTIASDDIAGVKYQRVKLSCGADGAATDVTIGNGTAATALRVTLANDSTGTTAVTNAGTFAVQVDGAALTALQLIDDAVYADDDDWTDGVSKHMLVGGLYQTTPQTITDGDVGPLQVNANGILKVIGVDANGDAVAAQVDDAAFTVATDGLAVVGGVATTDSVDSGDAGAFAMTTSRAQHVAVRMQSNGGWSSHHRNIDANAETEVKGSAGTLGWVHAINLTAAIAYLHIYDNTAAGTTPGTTTPTFTFPIPTAGSTNGAGFNLNFGAQGHTFGTGITYVVTTTIDGAAGDPGTNGVMVNMGYI